MSKRIEWADIAKGIAIILVVVGHSVSPTGLANKAIYAFHMPFFFFIFGYLFDSSRHINSFKWFIWNRFKRLMIPYFATGLIVFAYWYFIQRHATGDLNTPRAIFDILQRGFLYGAGQAVEQYPNVTPIGPMWFLPCLFVASVIFWVITRIPNQIVQWGLCIAGAVTGYSLGKDLFMPWSVDISLFALVFMMAGRYYRQKPEWLEKLPIWALAVDLVILIIDIRLGGISMNNREYNFVPLSIAGAIAGSVLLCYASYWVAKIDGPKKVLTYFGTVSLIILCYHTMDDGFFHWDVYVKFVYDKWDTLTLYRIGYSLLIVELIRRTWWLRKIYY